MAEGEPISQTIRQFLESIARKAKETKANERTARIAELQGEIKTQLEDSAKLNKKDPPTIASEQHNSKTFSDDLESNVAKKRITSQDKAHANGYAELGQDEASLILDATKAALAETKQKVPDWVHINDIQHDPATAQFAVTMAILPPELRTPEVILKEVSRLYYSENKWTRLSSEAFAERQAMVSRALEQVRTKRPKMTEGHFKDIIDRRYELYRARRMEPLPDSEKAGNVPKSKGKEKEKGNEKVNKSSVEYMTWEAKKSRELQRQMLEETLTLYQDQLDAPGGDNPQIQKEILQDLVNKLNNGYTSSLTYEDSQNGLKFTVNNKFNRDDIEKYVQQARSDKKTIEDYLEATKQREYDAKKQKEDLAREQKRQEDYKTQSIESGRAVVWTQEMTDLYKINADKIGQLVEIENNRGYFDQETLKEIFSGLEGQKKWLAGFRERNLNQKAQFKPDLDTQSELGAFKRMVEGLWKKERPSMSQWIRNNIDLFEEIDSVTFAIRSRPSGDKVEEVVNILKFFGPQSIETILETDYIDITYPLTGEALEYVLQTDLARKDKALNELLNHKISNPFESGTTISENNLLTAYEKKLFNAKGLLDDSEYAEMISLMDKQRQTPRDVTSDELLKLSEYQKKTGRDANNPLGDLTEAQYKHYKVLLAKLDTVGRGVLLRDYHMIANQRKHGELRSIQIEYKSNQQLLDPPEQQGLSDVQIEELKVKQAKLTADQITELKTKQVKLREQFNMDWEEFSHGYSQAIDISDVHNLEAVANLSPVDMVVRERAIDALIREGKDLQGNVIDKQWIEKNEWKVYEAVVAAKNMALGTGQTMEISAKKAQTSSIELRFLLGRPDNPKYFMERMFAEAYCRVLNGSLFADDFHMRGPMGDDIRDVDYVNSFEAVGYKMADVMNNKLPSGGNKEDFNRWIEKRNLLMKNHAPKWVLIEEYAKEILGLGYSEVARPDLLMTGLTVSSSWRYTHMGLDELAKAFTKEKGEFGGLTPDYEALGLRINAASDREKPFYLDLLKQRKISAYINNMGSDLERVVSQNGTGIHVLDNDWRTFSRSLCVSEMQLWKDKEHYRFKKFDFGNKQDFEGVMRRSIQAVTQKEATQAQLDRYFQVLQNVTEYMDGASANGKTRVDNWAKHQFQYNTVLTRSDFNVKDFDYAKINAFSLQRRINDYKGQAKANEIKREIFYVHPEKYLYPAPGKEIDAVMMVSEYKETINGYSGVEGAEIAGMVMLDDIVEWNYNFVNKSLAGFVPGLVTGITWLPKISDGNEAIRNGLFGIMERTKSGKQFVKTYGLRHKHPSEWPNRMCELVSHDMKWTQGSGNKWDEIRVAGIFEAAEELKMATTHDAHEMLKKMQSKYRSTMGWRFLWTIPRQYWWAVPVATVAFGIIASDEKKKSH